MRRIAAMYYASQRTIRRELSLLLRICHVAWSVSPSLLDFCRRSLGWHIEPQSRDSPPSFLDLSAPFLGPLSSFVESRCWTFRRRALCIHRHHSEPLLASLVLVPKTIAHNFPAPIYVAHIVLMWCSINTDSSFIPRDVCR